MGKSRLLSLGLHGAVVVGLLTSIRGALSGQQLPQLCKQIIRAHSYVRGGTQGLVGVRDSMSASRRRQRVLTLLGLLGFWLRMLLLLLLLLLLLWCRRRCCSGILRIVTLLRMSYRWCGRSARRSCCLRQLEELMNRFRCSRVGRFQLREEGRQRETRCEDISWFQCSEEGAVTAMLAHSRSRSGGAALRLHSPIPFVCCSYWSRSRISFTISSFPGWLGLVALFLVTI